MKSPDTELRHLVDAWHDGTILPEEALRLEKRLLEEADAREHFFSISDLEGSIRAEAAKLSLDTPITKSVLFAIRPLLKVAAVFLVGLIFGFMFPKNLQDPSINGNVSVGETARITGMLGISWDDPIHQHLSSPEHETQVSAGLVELTFASGTRALIEGPASFQVNDGNSMNLGYGKLVADVPKGAEGFTVAYAGGKIVDIGTEFGVEVTQDGKSAHFGVFRGEIEFYSKEQPERLVRLSENHAVDERMGKVTSVPFATEKFTRKLPSREFSWEITGLPDDQDQILEYDVSHLIWKSARYRVICKWMRGEYGMEIKSAELTLDGKLVDTDNHLGFASDIYQTRNNIYLLEVPKDSYRRGVWKLRLHVRSEAPIDTKTAGVILLEDGLALDASKEEFIGTWEYSHDGVTYQRTFLPDGSARLTQDGKEVNLRYHKSKWNVENGILVLEVTDYMKNRKVREEHLIRNKDLLIFGNRPYRDAHRVKDKESNKELLAE